MSSTLPPSFAEHTRALMGASRFSILQDALGEEPRASIRLNPFKVDADKVWPQGADAVPWCRYGAQLKSRPEFTLDPLLHAGLYYVQESSSMFLDHVLRTLVHQPVRMLDLCAAPGGKTTCAMAALPQGSTLYSNEPVKKRANVLAENVIKFGHPDVVVTNNYAGDYQKAGFMFDVILADVPCSGEGMFRKDAMAVEEWSPSKVEQCQRLQREIVSDIWPCLQPGGILVYSTCTFNEHENEENALWIAHELGADFVEIPIEADWHITPSLMGDLPAYRFIPGFVQGEGLFLTVLRKHGESNRSRLSATKPKSTRGLRVLCHGVAPDIQKGKNSIPDITRALMTNGAWSSPNSMVWKGPLVDVDYISAINFLRHEAITLPLTAPLGIVQVRWRGYALGFAKNIGNRANNLYPPAWKIKTTHLRATPPETLSLPQAYAN